MNVGHAAAPLRRTHRARRARNHRLRRTFLSVCRSVTLWRSAPLSAAASGSS